MTTANRRIDVLCVGLVVADHVAAPIDSLPEAGTLAFTPRTELTIGGCAANVAVNLSKLGFCAGIVALVGDDTLGRFVRESLERHQVDCRAPSVSPQAQTAVTLVVNVRGEDRRFIHAAGANVELTGLDISADMLADCALLYVGGFGLNPALSGRNVAALFDAAHDAGVMTALDVVVGDPSVMAAMLEPVLPRTDLFLPNQDEAKVITGLDDPLEQSRRFFRQGAKQVVITSGADGAVFVESGRTLLAPAHVVAPIDGTGSGDAFAAGFMAGLIAGVDARECLAWGAAMGASCVQSPGATTGTFRRDQLDEFLGANPLTVETLDSSAESAG